MPIRRCYAAVDDVVELRAELALRFETEPVIASFACPIRRQTRLDASPTSITRLPNVYRS